MPALQPGDAAPDFEMTAVVSGIRKKLHLSEYRGKKNVALAFYAFAFTGG